MVQSLGSDVIKCQKTTYDGFKTVPYIVSPYQEDQKVGGSDMLFVMSPGDDATNHVD